MITESYLKHHGIKGQKWGVRHGPPYPLKKRSDTRKGVYDRTEKTKHLPDSIKMAAGVVASLGANYITISQGYINPAAVGSAVITTLSTPVFAIDDIAGQVKTHKIKKLLKSEVANEKIDEKTGFLKKNREMSIEEDMKRVNPMYDSPVYDAKNNCALCSVTYDLRRRGFDVCANLSNRGYSDREIEKIYKNARFEPYFGDSVGIVHNAISDKDYSKFSESMNKSAGKRGLVSIGWKGSYSGHEIAYEKTDAGYTFIDAQTRKQYSSEEFEKMIKKRASCVTYMRTDNKQFNLEELENVTKKYV